MVVANTQIPKQLRAHSFTYKDALKCGLSRQQLRGLVQSGEVDHFGRDLYQVVGLDYTEEDQFRIAMQFMGSPSAICRISALSYYDCTDIIPKQTWIMVPANKRTRHKSIRLIRMSDPKWSIGIVAKSGYSITSLERTLVEAVAYKDKIGSPIGIQAVKYALSSKKLKLKDLTDMAIQLGLFQRVKKIIEVL